MKTFDRVIGFFFTMASALAATGNLILLFRTSINAGDVIWPWFLAGSLAFVCAWIGVWAWANERWLLAAPTIFLGSLGAAGLMSILSLIPMGFAGLALCRAIRGRFRTA